MNFEIGRMFFQGWSGILRTLVVGVLAYAALILLLRISGKRTLSKMNAFDLIVTVALGSTLATVVLSKTTALIEGLTAFGLLILLQFAITTASLRSKYFERLIKAEPSLLLYRGAFMESALRKERVTKEEVRAAVRAEGHADLEAVEAVVLETGGTFSIIPKKETATIGSALGNIQGFPER